MVKICEILSIPKSKHTYRQIYKPLGEYKCKLAKLSKKLSNLGIKYDELNVSFGFMPGRNNVMNAIQHSEKPFIVSLDIENFFDNITVEMLEGILSEEELDLCFFNKIARQGLPTSPAVSNLAFSRIDRIIYDFVKSFTKEEWHNDLWMYVNVPTCTYSRYADDLTFGCENINEAHSIIKGVRQILTDHGFNINKKKTKIQDIRNGRVIITGVALDSKGRIYPPRYLKRKLRSAKHQLHSKNGHTIGIYNHKVNRHGNNLYYVVKGLRESIKLKLPNELWIKEIIKELNLDLNNQIESDDIKHCISSAQFHIKNRFIKQYSDVFFFKNKNRYLNSYTCNNTPLNFWFEHPRYKSRLRIKDLRKKKNYLDNGDWVNEIKTPIDNLRIRKDSKLFRDNKTISLVIPTGKKERKLQIELSTENEAKRYYYHLLAIKDEKSKEERRLSKILLD